MKQQEEFFEYGARPEELKAYIVERSFYLLVRFGPLEPMPKGAMVWLSKRTGDEAFFSGRAVPRDLAERFKVIQPFRDVKDGEWLDLAVGDVLKLTREEAIKFLREGKVKEAETDEG